MTILLAKALCLLILAADPTGLADYRLLASDYDLIGSPPRPPLPKPAPKPTLGPEDELVFVTSPVCPACKRMEFETLPELRRRKIIYRQVDVGREADKAFLRKHNIVKVPTWLILRKDREVARYVGYAKPANIVDWWKRLRSRQL